jgi:hypothetical protein
MPIGNDFPTYCRISSRCYRHADDPTFDARIHEVRIAAEVLDFDPTRFMDPRWPVG